MTAPSGANSVSMTLALLRGMAIAEIARAFGGSSDAAPNPLTPEAPRQSEASPRTVAPQVAGADSGARTTLPAPTQNDVPALGPQRPAAIQWLAGLTPPRPMLSDSLLPVLSKSVTLQSAAHSAMPMPGIPQWNDGSATAVSPSTGLEPARLAKQGLAASHPATPPVVAEATPTTTQPLSVAVMTQRTMAPGGSSVQSAQSSALHAGSSLPSIPEKPGSLPIGTPKSVAVPDHQGSARTDIAAVHISHPQTFARPADPRAIPSQEQIHHTPEADPKPPLQAFDGMRPGLPVSSSPDLTAAPGFATLTDKDTLQGRVDNAIARFPADPADVNAPQRASAPATDPAASRHAAPVPDAASRSNGADAIHRADLPPLPPDASRNQQTLHVALSAAIADSASFGAFPFMADGRQGNSASLVIFNAAMIPSWPPALRFDQAMGGEKALQLGGANLAQMTPEQAAEYIAKMAAGYDFLLKVKKRLAATATEEKELLLGLFSFLGAALDSLVRGLRMAVEQSLEQQEMLAEVLVERDPQQGKRGRRRIDL